MFIGMLTLLTLLGSATDVGAEIPSEQMMQSWDLSLVTTLASSSFVSASIFTSNSVWKNEQTEVVNYDLEFICIEGTSLYDNEAGF